MKKIVLVGPVYPYKGGISHYTGLMYKALSKKYQVVMVSYKLQYPKFLFKKEQRDYENNSFKIEGTNYWLHTVYPWNWVATAAKIKKQKADIVIFQWWHPYFAPCYWLLCKCLKGMKILFVCHNVFPHERFPLDRFLAKSVLRQGSGYIVQSKMDGEDLHTIIKHPVFRQTVHPTYNAFQIKNMTKEEARAELGIGREEKILLFFGFIREYKGLKYLIEAMRTVTERFSDVKLLVVGDFSGAESKQEYMDRIEQCGAGDAIEVYDGYIPDKEVEKFFAACDLVTLPYISATQSGIVQIAFGFEKPVIVTDVGGLPDVVEDGKTGYVVGAGNPEELAKAVIRYFTSDVEKQFRENIKKEAYRFSWDRMTEVVEELDRYDGREDS